METWDAITARRNVREFADRVIPDADLDRVPEAGRIRPLIAGPARGASSTLIAHEHAFLGAVRTTSAKRRCR